MRVFEDVAWDGCAAAEALELVVLDHPGGHVPEGAADGERPMVAQLSLASCTAGHQASCSMWPRWTPEARCTSSRCGLHWQPTRSSSRAIACSTLFARARADRDERPRRPKLV